MSNNQSLSLVLTNDLSEIARAADEIEKFGVSQEWPLQWISNTNLALDELVTNAVLYGLKENAEDTNIIIKIAVENGDLVIRMLDKGIPFNPFQEVTDPSLDLQLEDMQIGGLGVYFVKTLMSAYHYERVDGVNNITLIQRLDSS